MMSKEAQASNEALLRGLVAKEKGLPIDEVTDDVIGQFFRECTKAALPNFPAWVRDHFQPEEAMNTIGLRLFDPNRAGFDPQRNTSFRVWCETVIRNKALDLLRDARRERPYPDEIGWPGAQAWNERNELSVELAAPEPDAWETMECREQLPGEVRKWRDDFRQLLDNIGWPAPKGSKVDYFAVLLFELRLRLTAELGGHVEGVDYMRGDAGSLFLPWRPAEESRAFRPGWPPIGEVWSELAPRLDKPPYVGLLCETIGRLAAARGVEAALSPATWRQWYHRAADVARERLTDEQWEQWLARWLPSRKNIKGLSHDDY